MARPAGVAGIFASSGMSTATDWNASLYTHSLRQGTQNRVHALRHHSPYAAVAGPKWIPAEAKVQPTAMAHGAGCVSGGSIDNTYLPQPLTNAWGKARERATNEVYKPPHKQSTDLLIVSKGAKLPPPPQSVADMESVRPIYSMTIPVYHPMDPVRIESGFVRSPNIIPGAMPPPVSPMNEAGDFPGVPSNHALLKLKFDQSMHGVSRIPVSRVVRSEAPRPQSAAPVFFRRAAGLPGGLSIIQAE